MTRPLRAAVLLPLLAAAAYAGPGGRAAVEVPVSALQPGSPVPALQLKVPAIGAAALSPSAGALVPTVFLAPALPAPSVAAPAAAAAAAPAERPKTDVAALAQTGALLPPAAGARGAPTAAPADGGAASLDALFEHRGRPSSQPFVAVRGPGGAPLARLAPRTKGLTRSMPKGVLRAYQNSAVLGGGSALTFAGLALWLKTLVPFATPAQLALFLAPLGLLPVHFLLVSGFWAGRHLLYPRLGDGGQLAFRAAWTALTAAYVPSAFLLLAAWLAVVSNLDWRVALAFSPAWLAAAGEVLHHFVYRLAPEKAAHQGQPMSDWRARLGGNIGQQLRRLRRRDGRPS